MLKNDTGLLTLRVAFGALMLFGHGASKLASYADLSASFPDPLGIGSAASLALAIGAEVGASLFIILGLATRWSLFPLLFTMFIAFIQIHGDDPFPRREKALLYGIVYLVLMITGPGRFSLDHLLSRRFQFWRKINPA